MFPLFLTFKKWTALYILCLLGLFVIFGAILWRGSAVNVSRSNIVLTPDTPVLIIDAGHGGEDGGAVSGDGTPEAGINLAIALQMEEIARLAGREVVLTRETDISLHGEGAQTLAEKKREDEEKVPGIVKEYSRVGIRQYARGRAYDPYRYSEDGPTPYPGEEPIFAPTTA